jgi:hypothetical protein
MNVLKITMLVFAFSFVVSCTCYRQLNGVVIDYSTRNPIDKVKIADEVNRVIYTDSLGHFEYFSMYGRLLRCGKISLSFEKEGYVETSKRYKSCCTDNVVVILKHENDL